MKRFLILWLYVVTGDKRDELHPKTRRIINGERAAPGQFPWLVALLGYADGSQVDYFNNQFCGGALIADNWVLSATHCIDDISTSDLSVIIGATSLASWYSETFFYNGVQYEPEWRDVIQVYAHPSSDLALLKLSEPSNLPQLRYTSITPAPGTLAQNMGFGDTHIADEIAEFPEDLYYITLPIVDDATCEDRLSTFGYSLFDNREEICAGYKDAGFAPCQGDSGGPLIVESSSDGEFEVVGVVSWGPGCGGTGTVDVYADVTALVNYIESVIFDEDDNNDDVPVDTGLLTMVNDVWCDSDLNIFIDKYDSIQTCWNNCYQTYSNTLIAVDYWPNFDCWCQNSCDCVHYVTGAATYGFSDQVLGVSECDQPDDDPDDYYYSDDDEDDQVDDEGGDDTVDNDDGDDQVDDTVDDDDDGDDQVVDQVVDSNVSSSSKKRGGDLTPVIITASVAAAIVLLILIIVVVCCFCSGCALYQRRKDVHQHRELSNEEEDIAVTVRQKSSQEHVTIATERVQVTIPPGAVEGQTFYVPVRGNQTAVVQVPRGASPGSTIAFDIPAGPPTQPPIPPQYGDTGATAPSLPPSSAEYVRTT